MSPLGHWRTPKTVGTALPPIADIRRLVGMAALPGFACYAVAREFDGARSPNYQSVSKSRCQHVTCACGWLSDQYGCMAKKLKTIVCGAWVVLLLPLLATIFEKWLEQKFF